MMRVLIADDEALARNRLRELLSDIGNFDVVAEACNGKEALALAAEKQPDIILLDIRMPEMDGIEVARHLQTLAKPPFIIFTTAFDAYAIQAFDMNAIDYLLKPIRTERLRVALNKAHALLPRQLEAVTALQPKRTHLSINERNRILLVPVEDIVYLRAELKYITVRTTEKEYLLEESLIHLEQEFGDIFIRLHRNCLVAKSAILGYEKQSHDEQGKEEHGERHWVVLLKGVPETVAVSRRQQHLMHQTNT